MVNIDPEILDVLSGHISDVEQRTQMSVADTRTAAVRVQVQIADEVSRRRRRVEELSNLYDECCRMEDADCSELRRLLVAAEHALDVGIRALTQATEAIAEHGTQANAVVRQMGLFAAAGKQTISKLQRNIEDYSAFSSLVPASVLGASYVGQPTASGAESGGTAKLSATNQVYHSVMSGNRELKVFDHPKQTAHNAVFGQGSAKPTTFLGTCGLCAVGTILRLAGIRADEGRVTDYAAANRLCTTNAIKPSFNGGTSSSQLVSILQGYGDVSARSHIGKSMEALAVDVEQGRGVIIGLNPTLINESWYGPYDPISNSAHWVVLQSVVRDASTNKVLGFYVFDSNGETAAETCQLHTISKLQTAYTLWGARSVVTEDIIW